MKNYLVKAKSKIWIKNNCLLKRIRPTGNGTKQSLFQMSAHDRLNLDRVSLTVEHDVRNLDYISQSQTKEILFNHNHFPCKRIFIGLQRIEINTRTKAACVYSELVLTIALRTFVLIQNNFARYISNFKSYIGFL